MEGTAITTLVLSSSEIFYLAMGSVLGAVKGSEAALQSVGVGVRDWPGSPEPWAVSAAWTNGLSQPWEKLFCNHCRVTWRALCVERTDLGFGSDWNCSWNLRVGFSKAAAEIWMKNSVFEGSENAECQCWSSGRCPFPWQGSWNEIIFKGPSNKLVWDSTRDGVLIYHSEM